jgi:hypothetical protein
MLPRNPQAISNTTYIRPRTLWNEFSRDISGLRRNIRRGLDRLLRSSRGCLRRRSDCFLSWGYTGGFWGVCLIGDSGLEIVLEFGLERELVGEMQVEDIFDHRSRFLSRIQIIDSNFTLLRSRSHPQPSPQSQQTAP